MIQGDLTGSFQYLKVADKKDEDIYLIKTCLNRAKTSGFKLKGHLHWPVSHAPFDVAQAFWAASAHCKLMLSFSSTITAKSFSAGLLSVITPSPVLCLGLLKTLYPVWKMTIGNLSIYFFKFFLLILLWESKKHKLERWLVKTYCPQVSIWGSFD